MDLTIFERKLLINQYEVLKFVNPSDREYYEKYQQILEDGYQPLYKDLFQYIDADELTNSDRDFVYNTLSMYEAFQNFENKNPGQKHLVEKEKFFGFDGNNSREIRLAAFARFSVEKEHKWEYLHIKEYNSHMPAEAIYRRMLSAWLPLEMAERFSLTVEQVQRILTEKIHPENRNK